MLKNSRSRLAQARLAGTIRELDDEVNSLQRALAVRQLELEMERVHIALENEARDIAETTGFYFVPIIWFLFHCMKLLSLYYDKLKRE